MLAHTLCYVSTYSISCEHILSLLYYIRPNVQYIHLDIYISNEWVYKLVMLIEAYYTEAITYIVACV